VRHIAVGLLYLLIAAAITYPLIFQMGTQFMGFDYGDAYENAHHIWWFTYALRSGEPLFYQTLMGYPNGIEGVTVQANVLQFFPAWLFAFVLPLPAAYNLQVLLTLALNGWAMYLFARELTRSEGAALLSGAVFMCFPTLQGHLGAGHTGLIVQWPLPLFALCVWRFTNPEPIRSVRSVLLAALFFVLTAFGHTLQVIYTLLPVSVFFVVGMIERRKWRGLFQLAIACGLAAVVLGLYLLPVFRAAAGTAAYAGEGGSVRYSADLLAAVTPSFFHPVYGEFAFTHRVLGTNLDEGAAYVGIIGALLTLIGIWKIRAARGWAALAAAVYVLSLGPLLKVFDQPVSIQVDGYTSAIALPWALVQDLPVFNLARTPGRFNFTLALAVAVMSAYGMGWILTRIRHVRMHPVVLAICILWVLFDYQTFSDVLPRAPADVPEAIAGLRGRDDVRAVLDVPWDNLVVAKAGIYLQTAHERPLIAGQVTRRTPVNPALLTLLETTLDPALLAEAGADIVIVHRRYDGDGALESHARAQLGPPIYEDARFAVFETPSPRQPPRMTIIPPSSQTLSQRLNSYIYVPEPGWLLADAAVTGDNREVALQVDDEVLWRGTVVGGLPLHVPVRLADRGYYTLSLTLEPPCPTQIPPAMICNSVVVDALAPDAYRPDSSIEAIAFANGLTLRDAFVASEALVAGERLPIWLWWQFAEGRTAEDVRFVHLLDETGILVVQADNSLGEQLAGAQLAEEVSLNIPPDLAPGRYGLYVGWYRFPDFARLPVLSATPRAQDGLAFLGDVTLMDD
jgi:hypothetical protein